MAWTIYDSRLPMFSNNYTGGGLMIKNICEYIGRLHESYLFIGRYKVPEMIIGNIHIVGTEIYPDIQDDLCNPDDKHIKTMEKAFEAVVDKIKPDIVNFHGIGGLMQRCVEVCINKKIPYVYTDHLFVGGAEIQGYDKNRKWEKEVYNIPDLKVIAVSSGMKTKILQNYPNFLSKNITVIKNGTDFIAEWQDSDLIKKYDLKNKKVLLCVGTINYRKNQCQVIRSFQMLPLSIQNKVKVVFCGKDSMNGILQECITASGLQDKLIYAGAVSSEDMKKHYSIADGLIMTSYV